MKTRFERPNKDLIQDAEQFKEKHPKSTYRELIKSTTKNAEKKKQLIEKKNKVRERKVAFRNNFYTYKRVRNKKIEFITSNKYFIYFLIIIFKI